MTLMRRRVSGFIVVSHIISGSFSPRPFERATEIFFLELLQDISLLRLVIGEPRFVLAVISNSGVSRYRHSPRG